MRAGLRDEKIMIETLSYTYDASGSEIITPERRRTASAKVYDNSGRVSMSDSGTLTRQDVVFIVPPVPGLAPKRTRIFWRGDFFDVINVSRGKNKSEMQINAVKRSEEVI